MDISTYSSFVKCKKNYNEWQSDLYFRMYYEAFISSAEYGNKSKQKNFIKLSEADKLLWFNEHFYDYAQNIEKEKLTYFALISINRQHLLLLHPMKIKHKKSF